MFEGIVRIGRVCIQSSDAGAGAAAARAARAGWAAGVARTGLCGRRARPTTTCRLARLAVLLSAGVVLAGQADPARGATPGRGAAGDPAAAAPPATPAEATRAQRTPPPAAVSPARLRTRVELRERMEGLDGIGFDRSRQDLYWLSRVRLDVSTTPAAHLALHVQVQDARVSRKGAGPTGAPFSAPADLRLAAVDLGSAAAPVTIRLGRQELVYGEQRLVGHVGWLNAARSFDGVKVTLRTPAVQVDTFATSLVRVGDGLDRSGAGHRFAGAYAATTRIVPKATVEPFFFWKRDVNLGTEAGAVGDLELATIGLRIAGRLTARLDYGAEVAVQRGSLGTDTVRAWAGHWQVRESLPGPGAVRVIAEYNHASGDEDPGDGVRGTFDQLYPTPHDKYGLADQIGWKNLHHVRGGVEFAPLAALPVTATYHAWWLAEPRDALYAASGAPVARVITGAAGRRVGQELDVQASRALGPSLQLAAGYAHLVPGAFLRQTTRGGAHDYVYVMATYVLAVER
jgi:hypothetical protein